MNFNIEFLNDEILKEGYFLPFDANKNGGVWRDEQGQVIALIQGEGIEDLSTTSIDIVLFEVRDKRKGHGRKCIESLFYIYENLEEITGKSLQDAYEFWETIGVEFIDFCEDCVDYSSCVEHGFCCDATGSNDFVLSKYFV